MSFKQWQGSVASRGIWHALEELEDFYGMSDRRLYDHARKGRIVGIEYADGAWRFSCHPGFEGPIPAIPHEYLAPKSIQGVVPEQQSGVVSSAIVICSVKLDRRTPVVELRTVTSGAIYRLWGCPQAG